VIHKRVTVAHISDIHLAGKNDRRTISMLARMLDHLTAIGIDHLVITGDLCDAASPGEWAVMRDLLRECGFWSWERTTVLPGNHDLINLEEEMRIYNALNPFPGSRRKALRERVAAFCSMFGELMNGNPEVPARFPFVKVIRFSPIAIGFVAVDSVWPWHRSDNPLGARGLVDPSQLRALSQPEVADALKESFVIGLCHHALKVYGTMSPVDQAFDWTMELINRNDYISVMKDLRANVVLHGHFHRFQTYEMEGITVVNGGSFRYVPYRYSRMTIGEGGEFSQQFVDLPVAQ